MGTPIPTEPIDIDPTKWYRVTMQQYNPPPLTPPCTNPVAQIQCCLLGETILDWIRTSQQCGGDELCTIKAVGPQSLVQVFGPFGTKASCELSL